MTPTSLRPRVFILFVVLLFFVTSITSKKPICTSDVCHVISQRISDGVDTSVDPCDDFYEFSCGNWMKRNPIPDERSWWSPWSISRIQLKKQVKKLLDEDYDGNNIEILPSVKKAIDLYKGCLDLDARERTGLVPLKQILDKIGGWPLVDRQWSPENYSWASAYTYLRGRLGLNYIINMYVDVDSKKTSRRIIYLDRPTLGLGRSELQDPRESQETRTLVSAYKTYIRSSAQKLSFDNNIPNSLLSKDVNDMIRFETRLAFASSALEDRRDHFGLYNRMTIRQLEIQFPGVSFLDSIVTSLTLHSFLSAFRFAGLQSFAGFSNMLKCPSQKMMRLLFKTQLIIETWEAFFVRLLLESLPITLDGDMFLATLTTQQNTSSKPTSTSKKLLMEPGNQRKLGKPVTQSLTRISLIQLEGFTLIPTSIHSQRQ